MLNTNWAGLAPYVVGGLMTLSGVLANGWLTARRERKQHVREREAGRVVALEERAGQTFDLVHKQMASEQPSSQLLEMMRQLMAESGKLKRYAELSEAARTLHHWCGCVMSDRYGCHDSREASREAGEALKRLLNASRKILEQ